MNNISLQKKKITIFKTFLIIKQNQCNVLR